jgi:3-hydroxyisobutyrate dehydrogenase-like beta-hydroxyacid dehydrogenase
MGSGLARLLTAHGVQVLTALSGRSDASRARAAAAGMQAVPLEGLAQADFILSILPPAHALPFARSLVPILRNAVRKPLFVDCNAVSPQTLKSIAGVLRETEAAFVDVGIIGLPPQGDYPGPRLYAAGKDAARLISLNDYGLQICLLETPIGSASALKMAYAGRSKGLTAVASSMILAATRDGVAGQLQRELAASEPLLLASLARRIPDMLPKAYRWVEEMEQIRQFAAADPAAAEIYAGAGKLYERIAADFSGAQLEIAAFDAFLSLSAGDPGE